MSLLLTPEKEDKKVETGIHKESHGGPATTDDTLEYYCRRALRYLTGCLGFIWRCCMAILPFPVNSNETSGAAGRVQKGEFQRKIKSKSLPRVFPQNSSWVLENTMETR